MSSFLFAPNASFGTGRGVARPRLSKNVLDAIDKDDASEIKNLITDANKDAVFLQAAKLGKTDIVDFLIGHSYITDVEEGVRSAIENNNTDVIRSIVRHKNDAFEAIKLEEWNKMVDEGNWNMISAFLNPNQYTGALDAEDILQAASTGGMDLLVRSLIGKGYLFEDDAVKLALNEAQQNGKHEAEPVLQADVDMRDAIQNGED